MKLSEIRPHYETSGDMEEEFFSIQDQGMIFDILRNKMYSNPILAICREISCNARDAHREVKTPEVPIHIYLPNNLEPYYKVKDFGPGISPDRMYNVFIKYTASTKRNDNIQTGGFGLGAKTPFSYSDSFSIVTNYDGIQYNYGCAIDETKVGKLALLSQSPTTEPNGTEIIIPVKPTDFRAFADWTEQATRHFETRPTIKGNVIKWEDITPLFSGDRWLISSTSDYRRTIKLVIDGIEYPLEIETLKKYANTTLIDAARGNLILYFGVGELSLSASREQVYLDVPTQKKIKDRLDCAINEIKKNVEDKIASFPDLWQANIFYKKDLLQVFNSLSFLGRLSWEGCLLTDRNYIPVNCNVFKFSKGKYFRKFGLDPNKITHSISRKLHFEEHSALFVNDLSLKKPTPRHVKKIFEDDATLTNVFVVSPDDNASQQDLNKSIHLDKMNPQLLSTVTKASGRNYTPATSRLLVFKLDPSAITFRQISYADIEDDTNKKVLCRLNKESYPIIRQIILKNKKRLEFYGMKSILSKFPGFSFYGVDLSVSDDRIEKDFSDFVDIEYFIEEKVLTNKNIDYPRIKYAGLHSYSLDDRAISNYDKLKKSIVDPNSMFLKKLKLHHELRKLIDNDSGILAVYEAINGEIKNDNLKKFVKDNPDQDLEEMKILFAEKYPLLSYVNTYNYTQIVKHIADYVNLIDKI